MSTDQLGHCTETALVKVKNDTGVGLDQGEGGVLLVLLDLTVIFDTIILLDRPKDSFGATGQDYTAGYRIVVSHHQRLTDRANIVLRTGGLEILPE